MMRTWIYRGGGSTACRWPVRGNSPVELSLGVQDRRVDTTDISQLPQTVPTEIHTSWPPAPAA